MTAQPPPSVETLAVAINALSRRLDDALQSLSREETIRTKELDAWREAHNHLLSQLREPYERMLTRTEYQREHSTLTAEFRRVETQVTQLVGQSSGISKSLAMILLVMTGLSLFAGLVGALHAFLGRGI